MRKGPYSHYIKTAQKEITKSAPLYNEHSKMPLQGTPPLVERNPTQWRSLHNTPSRIPGTSNSDFMNSSDRISYRNPYSPHPYDVDNTFYSYEFYQTPQTLSKHPEAPLQPLSPLRTSTGLNELNSRMAATPNDEWYAMEDETTPAFYSRQFRSPSMPNVTPSSDPSQLPSELNRMPLEDYTSPKAEYEAIYGPDNTEQMRSKAIAAQNEWQTNNPSLLKSVYMPNYSDPYWSRKIGIVRPYQIDNVSSEDISQSALSKFDNPISYNASYNFDKATGKEFFIDEDPIFNRYMGSNANYGSQPPPIPPWGTADAAIGAHEAAHSLQPKLSDPYNFRFYSQFPDSTEQGGSYYGLTPAEFPAHVSEMKARYYMDSGTTPFMDTPEQRKSFMDFWKNKLNDPNITTMEQRRYSPVFRYLNEHPEPREQEFLLRSIVSNKPYDQYNGMA